jgi:VWFA-related protein
MFEFQSSLPTSRGRPVTGLRSDDFRVLDDGKRATIDTVIAFSTPAGTSARFTVFYLEDRRLSLAEMVTAKQAVASALSAALEFDGYVAIVTGTGSVNSGFSRNPDQLRKVLASIQTTVFASTGGNAHNFDLLGTYASLSDYATRMSKLPGRRLLVLISPGFFNAFPENRHAAEVSIGRIVQSGVVLNSLMVPDPGPLNADTAELEELSSATGGSFFRESSAPSTIAQYPELLYLLDIPLSAIRADGSLHHLKVTVSSPGSRLHARESFIAPR